MELPMLDDASVDPVVETLMALACFASAFMIVASLNWLEMIPWRKSAGKHWSERARILYPVRKSASIHVFLVPLLVVAGSLMIAESHWGSLLPRGLAGYAGAIGAGWFMVRWLFPGTRLLSWLREIAVGLGIRLGVWILLGAVAVTMPEEFNSRVWLTLAGVVALLVAWPWLGINLLRLCGVLRPAGERLRRIVAACTRENGPRVRGVWQARGIIANAFALPLMGTLLFFDSLLEILDDEEAATICEHEMGHLAESGWILFGRYLGVLAVLPLLLIKPAIHQWGLTGMFAMLLLVIVWTRLTRRLVHRMELRADTIAGGNQTSGGAYARALEKIYQYNRMPAVMPGKINTHPHLYDRMLAAGVVPDFPRPAAPRKNTPLGWILLFALPFCVMWLVLDDEPPHREQEFPTDASQPDGAIVE